MFSAAAKAQSFVSSVVVLCFFAEGCKHQDMRNLPYSEDPVTYYDKGAVHVGQAI